MKIDADGSPFDSMGSVAGNVTAAPASAEFSARGAIVYVSSR